MYSNEQKQIYSQKFLLKIVVKLLFEFVHLTYCRIVKRNM